MNDYLRQHGGTKRTPQLQPLPGREAEQVANSAGGYVWELDPWMQLRRFLILGTEGPSYYASERTRTLRMVGSLRACISADGVKAVNEIVAISTSGRAPHNDPALYALAACISLGDVATRRAAAEALPSVARIGTHLYHFVSYAETMRGWGRTMRWAVSNWYKNKGQRLEYEAIKYRERDGWSHRDLLRLAHPHPGMDADFNETMLWIAHPDQAIVPDGHIAGLRRVQQAKSGTEIANLIREYGLPREALPTEALNDPRVWVAMLESKMPMTAMVRNLATMTRIGVLDDHTYRDLVCDSITSADRLTRARVHPMTLLIALHTYKQGIGRGGRGWKPIPRVLDALDEAFYLAFANVKPSGKRNLLALDVSPSMGRGQVAGSPLTPREASVAMALVTLHADPNSEVMVFASAAGGYWQNRGNAAAASLPLSSRQRLDDAVKMVTDIHWGGTDCSLPFRVSKRDGSGPENFVVYTDNETWYGQIHPKQALDEYRRESGINATSVVCGMVANPFTIADPRDPGMLDVVGFDTATPNLISDFASGMI